MMNNFQSTSLPLITQEGLYKYQIKTSKEKRKDFQKNITYF